MNDGYGWTTNTEKEYETYTYTNKFDSIPTTIKVKKAPYGSDKFMAGPTSEDWKKPPMKTKQNKTRKKTAKQIETEKKAKEKGVTVEEYKRTVEKIKRYMKEIEETEKRMAYIKNYIEEHKNYI